MSVFQVVALVVFAVCTVAAFLVLRGLSAMIDPAQHRPTPRQARRWAIVIALWEMSVGLVIGSQGPWSVAIPTLGLGGAVLAVCGAWMRVDRIGGKVTGR